MRRLSKVPGIFTGCIRHRGQSGRWRRGAGYRACGAALSRRGNRARKVVPGRSDRADQRQHRLNFAQGIVGRFGHLRSAPGFDHAGAENECRDFLTIKHKRGNIEVAAQGIAHAGFAFDGRAGELQLLDIAIDGPLGDFQLLRKAARRGQAPARSSCTMRKRRSARRISLTIVSPGSARRLARAKQQHGVRRGCLQSRGSAQPIRHPECVFVFDHRSAGAGNAARERRRVCRRSSGKRPHHR